MSVATVSSKGQITIPASIRSELHVGPGDRVEFVKVGDGQYHMIAATQSVRNLYGMVKPKRTLSLEEMDDAIAEGAARDRD